MNNWKLTFIFLLICFSYIHTFGIKNVQDVKIGKQVWAAKNLDVCLFRNGDTIHFVRTSKEWAQIALTRKPVCC